MAGLLSRRGRPDGSGGQLLQSDLAGDAAGLVAAPAALRRACVIAKQSADLHTPTINQLAAARYLVDNDLDAHIARIRSEYRKRRDAMLAGLPATLPTGSRWTRPEGGMFIWARLPGDVSELFERAVARDVAFVPGASFHVGRPDPTTMRLSFVTHTADEIAEGLRRLAAACSVTSLAPSPAADAG